MLHVQSLDLLSCLWAILLCAIPCYSINLAVCYICCGLFPQFGCVLYLIFAIPSILALCFICCVLFPRFWPCAIFAVCYSLDFGCVLCLLCAIFAILLWAISSILSVCYICCGQFPQFCCVLYLWCAIQSQFWLGPARGLGCALFLLYAMPSILTVCCFCFMLYPQFGLCAIFVVCYSQFGSVLCLLWAIPPNLAVCYICCVLFPQFRLCAAVFAVGYSLNFGCMRYSLYLELPTYCTIYDGYLEFVCLVVFNWSLFLWLCASA